MPQPLWCNQEQLLVLQVCWVFHESVTAFWFSGNDTQLDLNLYEGNNNLVTKCN